MASRLEGLRGDRGYTLVELLVAISVFAIASVAIYQLLFSIAEGSRTARSVTRGTDEARLGFNRMVRDTREGREIIATSTSPESFTVAVDFNADGIITPYPSVNSSGDYEELIYEYDATDEKLRLNGELLMDDIECVPKSGGGCKPIFDYASEDLEYDWNGDGVASWQELDEAAQSQHGVVGVGNDNGVLDAAELPYVTSVSFAVRVVKGDASSNYFARAQLRNNR